MKTTRASLCVLFFHLVLWTAAFAEKRSDLKTTPNPQVQCSICEDSDLTSGVSCKPRTVANYCNCRKPSQANVRVLYRDKSPQPYLEYNKYESQRISALTSNLLKQGKSPVEIKKAVSALKKKLKKENQGYLALCVPTVDTPTGDFTLLREVSGYGIYTLSNKTVSSFATGITEGGTIVGGTYAPLPTSPATLAEASATGLAFAQEESTQITPVVWTKEGPKPACTNCPPGLILSAANDLGQAVGVLRGRSPSAINFSYKNNLLQTLPSIAGATACAGRVNESGIVIGTLNCQLGQVETQGSDAIVWVNGVANKIERDTVLLAFEEAFKPIFLERIKKELRFPGLECSAADIELTKLIGRPNYKDKVDILAVDINSTGDIVGSILSLEMSWRYSSPCLPELPPEFNIPPPKFDLRPPMTTFLRTPAGLVDIRIDSNALSSLSGLGAVPLVLSNSRIALGMGSEVPDLRPARIDLSTPGAKWSSVALPSVAQGNSLIVGDANEKGDFVGFTYKSPPKVADTKAFAVIDGEFIDLNSLMGSGSDLTFRIATGINNCGQIVGRIIDSKTGVSQVALLSPKSCAKVKVQ